MQKNMNEEEAVKALKEYTSGKLYILLSTVNAEMMMGYSFPYVGTTLEGRIILMFTDPEYAMRYIDEQGYEVLDGIYPLGLIDNEKPALSLEMILNIALHLGIELVDINPGHESRCLGAKVSWMQDVLGFDKNASIQIMLNKSEVDTMTKDKSAKAPLRFNPMPILGFSNPFKITDERKKEIGRIPFEHAGNVHEYVDAIKDLPMNELIFFSELLKRRYEGIALKEKKDNDYKFFESLYGILEQVIIDRLDKIQIFTLLDNGEIFINQGKACYILYTDRFRYMGEYRYEETDLKSICDHAKSRGIDTIFVTAGPMEMHLTSVGKIREYLANKKR